MENGQDLKTALRERIENRVKNISFETTGEGLFFHKEKEVDSNREFVKSLFSDETRPTAFDALYDQAIGGSGSEDGNMCNAISSSLFAFLFFSRVSNDNPIIINGTKYTHVCFEFKNRTLSGKSDFAPSNIDVVLASDGYIDILFIESKFGEYFYSLTKKYDKLSVQYNDEENGPTALIIERLLQDKQSFLKFIDKDKQLLFLDEADKHYFEGIKQMLTHISGIFNFKVKRFCSTNHVHSYDISKKAFEDASQNADSEKNELTVALQEIVFDLDQGFGLGKNELGDYMKLHNCLQNCLQKARKEGLDLGFEVKPLITYQDFVDLKENEEYFKSLPPIIQAYFNKQEPKAD